MCRPLIIEEEASISQGLQNEACPQRVEEYCLSAKGEGDEMETDAMPSSALKPPAVSTT